MTFRVRWLPTAGLVVILVIGLPLAWLLARYLAGYGVPMLAGVLIGLLVVPGLAVLAALLVPVVAGWRFRRRVASYRQVARSGVSDQSDPVAMMAMSQQMESVESGQLRRVIGVGHTQIVDGVTLELLAIEIRHAGGTLTLRAQGSGPSFESDPSEPHFPQPNVAITDDAGTAYAAFPGGGGGGSGIYRYEARFAPAPPAAARRVTVTIGSYSDHFPVRRRSEPSIEGPWVFEVDLAGG